MVHLSDDVLKRFSSFSLRYIYRLVGMTPPSSIDIDSIVYHPDMSRVHKLLLRFKNCSCDPILFYKQIDHSLQYKFCMICNLSVSDVSDKFLDFLMWLKTGMDCTTFDTIKKRYASSDYKDKDKDSPLDASVWAKSTSIQYYLLCDTKLRKILMDVYKDYVKSFSQEV